MHAVNNEIRRKISIETRRVKRNELLGINERVFTVITAKSLKIIRPNSLEIRSCSDPNKNTIVNYILL